MADRTERMPRRVSLRARITLAATAVVGIALAVGALVFLQLLRVTLTEQSLSAVERDAAALAAQIEQSGVPADLDDTDDDGLVLLLDEAGSVLAVSESFTGVRIDIPTDDAVTRSLRDTDGDTEEYALAVDTAEEIGVGISDDSSGSGSGRSGGDATDEDADADADAEVIVVVGRALDSITDTVGTVGSLLLGVVPLLLGVVAVTTFLVVGRALRPVERMRTEVAAVTGARLDRRLAHPGSTDEIGRLATTLNDMLDRIEASQRSQRRFISDASHELKSPLASLRQYAEVARAYPDRFTSDELSEAMLDEGARLERLVQGMLLLARVDEGAMTVDQTTVDLDDLALREARRLRDSTTLRITSTGITAARVPGDEGLLAQVVRNLVDNAARHASEAVSIAVREEADRVVLTIDDDGAGIAGPDRARVFERFVRLDESRARADGGSGLGLAIVAEIVAAHGGTIAIGTSPEGGARIDVTLPAAS